MVLPKEAEEMLTRLAAGGVRITGWNTVIERDESKGVWRCLIEAQFEGRVIESAAWEEAAPGTAEEKMELLSSCHDRVITEAMRRRVTRG